MRNQCKRLCCTVFALLNFKEKRVSISCNYDLELYKSSCDTPVTVGAE